jgi:hypothetical protein
VEGAGKGKIVVFGKNRTFCVSEKRAGWEFHVLMKAKTMNMINHPDGVWTQWRLPSRRAGGCRLHLTPSRQDAEGQRQMGSARDGDFPAHRQRRPEAGYWRWLRPGRALSEDDDGTFRYFPAISGGEKLKSSWPQPDGPSGAWNLMRSPGRVDSGGRRWLVGR